MHMCYERPGVVAPLNGGVGQYEKWDRDRGAGSGGGSGSAWAGRDRERDRERERLARAHQMSHAHQPEPDASSLFPAPFRVTGNRDHVSQQIQHKLGDYHLAQSLIDDPSKSIGIYAEPQSPAPCTRRESEFKKPAHAPTNGRIHHRSYLSSKSDVPGSTGAPAHRPPPLKIPNGFQNKNPSDSSQPPIESILKEMKSLPTPLSVIAATPRKELENKFIFNPYTNKVQENPQLTNKDLKTPLPKPGIDDRISNSRSSTSPDVVNKDLVLSESDDDVGAATTTSLEPLITPIASASPSSGSSSPSDSESESSSAESSAPPAPTPAPAPPVQRSSWSLSNFAPPAQPPEQPYDGKELRHALADVKGKPSPISDMSDSEASSPSPVAVRRRRSLAHRASAASSDEDSSRTHNASSPRVPAVQKRGRPPKQRAAEDDNPPKKKRGRPRKSSAPPPAPPAAPLAAPPAAPPDSDPEPDPPPPPHIPAQDNKTHIFRKVFTPKKGDECGGKGGKGGKGKGGKGKGQVTIIEVTAPESGADDDERRNRERSTERRNEEAIARVSPPQETEMRRPERDHRIPDRQERMPTERDRLTAERERLQDRLPTERDRLPIDRDRLNAERERIPTDRDRLPTERERIPTERDRLPTDRDRLPTERDRIPADRERIPTERIPTERERIQTERTSNDRIPNERPPDRISTERMVDRRLPSDRTPADRIRPAIERERIEERKKKMRLSDEVERIDDKMSIEKLEDKVIDRLSADKMSERIQTDRYVKAEADVGSGLKLGRGSERLVEASSNGSIRSRLVVRVPLSRLRRELVRALQRPPAAPPRARAQRPPQHQEVVAATNHERTATGETIRYFSYFERLPSDALSDEDRDHKYYLDEATRLRQAAVIEQEPLARVMLYLESVLCFVLTGRVLELRELDSKGAFTVYRETIEYIKSIHSMPQRYRASPHSTFNKLDILSLRVQALLYLRMFKMYNREVKEYNKIVQEYQQKPAMAEAAASPLSPTPSPGGSVGSVGSGGSSGYCSLAHAVPAHAHHALLQLTKYYTFLYVAHDLWEQADCLCRLRPNQDLFIAVDRKCGPLSLSSTFRHLVQYVRYAISLLKSAHRE